MNAEIETYLDQLQSIKQDAPGLLSRLSASQFNWRPAPNRWSIADCFSHLNAAAREFVPVIDAAVADARSRGILGDGPFAYGLIERAFVWAMEPPPKLRVRAPRRFQPAAPPRSIDAVADEFMGWQEEIAALIRRADGLDLRRARHRSPATPLITYSLGTSFASLLAHERRHIWQARRVRQEPAFPGG
jgi:hypothetical protein